MRAYIAGPMRGIKRFNFDAFDEAAADLRARGFEVFNPAEHDRSMGFDPDRDVPTIAQMRQMIAWDIARLCESDLLFLLPGWERSKGANREYDVAEELGLDIEYPVETIPGGPVIWRKDLPDGEETDA